MSVLPFLENNYAAVATVNEDNLVIENVNIKGAEGNVKAFLVKPKNKQSLGCVLVIHENRGLNPHIKEVTKRIVAAGFLALALDALSPFGGTPVDENLGRELIGKLNPEKNLQNYLAALTYLRERKVGKWKNCLYRILLGGGMANKLATADPNLLAAVAV